MEPLRHDDPRLVGPYTVLSRYRESASAVRYLAYGPDGATVVVSVARPALAVLPAFQRRFQAEARTEERLAGGWVRPLLDSRTDPSEGDTLWTACGYVPALTLGEAVALAGPLPERAVRTLGGALAETLSRVHATGAVLQGLAPDTVTLAADGPRLTAFGALGAAASAEAMEGGRLSVRLGYLTPEQLEGEVPGPPSDIFVLGLLLAYAATGTTPLTRGPAESAAERIASGTAELEGVPGGLRPLVARCLAKEPGERPTAGAVAAELAPGGAAASAAGPGGWLPAALSASIADQAARVDTLHTPLDAARGGSADAPAGGPVDAVPGPPADATPGAVPEPDTRTTRIGRPRTASGSESGVGDRPTAALSLPHARPEPTALPLPPTAAPVPQQSQALPPAPGPQGPPGPPALPPGPVRAPAPAPTAPGGPSGQGRFASLRGPLGQPLGRRALITGIVAGAAGLVIGGGGVLALAGDEQSDGTDDKPLGTDDTPRRLTGLPPEALWAYEQKVAADEVLNAAVIGGRTLVLTSGSGATGVDVRTGRRLWRSAGAAALHQALPVSSGLGFVAGESGLLWISTASGAVEHRVDYADGVKGAPGLKVAGVTGTSDGQVWFTGAYRSGTGKAARVRTHLFAFDLTTREELWRTVIANGRAPLTPVYQLIAVREADIVVRQDAKSLLPVQVRAARGRSVYHCFDRATGKRTWSKSFGAVPPVGGSVGDARGRLFAAAADQLYAYDTASAERLWRRSGAPEVAGQKPFAFGTGTLVGSTLYVANRFQEVYALDPDSGVQRWKGTTEGPAWSGVPRISLSESGRTVLSADGLQVTAFGAKDGRRLWKFQNAGGPAPSPGADGAGVAAPPYQPLMAGRTAVIRRGGTFYALPVD
ncbi:PQQ-binding-like beta-propeller repeat protein [Streptomyces sp. NPDC058653]|uniref:outer membrane protein assembly factor BamB family protein n=1 Tax=Streptomyces sp. NPDC058653 TaxID=3346576 RepID=UPI003662338F